MSFNNAKSPREGGNVWSAGSRGSRGDFVHSNNDSNGVREGGSYRNSYSRRGRGFYGFRQDHNNNNDEEQIEILRDAIFIQNLPKNITRNDIYDVFSTVGAIKTDQRSGGPKIWIYKDRMTGEGNGRATVTYEDEEAADKAVLEYNDQHISSINCVVRVQLAQRRIRNYGRKEHGRFNYNRGYRGGHNHWNNGMSSLGFNSNGKNRSNNSRSSGIDFRGRGSGEYYGSSYRGNSYRGAKYGTANASNYSPH